MAWTDMTMFAPGASNAAGLKPFNLLSPPLLADYARAIQQEWSGFQGRALRADRSGYHSWGRPSLRLLFGVLTRAEVAYLATLAGACTVRCLDEDSNTWGNYSGVFLPPALAEVEKRRPVRENVPYDVIDLVVIP